ncbi:hypothetical protein WI41_18395 [Burkholderia latens]|uniref:Uncharacterized protein n=1 Tax=Burkholderia latens TaxID=488446 RepID=A0AAP1G944_9BURK|nr:hypothetical protein WI41_18395 [Burkholderia latens]
MVGKRRDSGGVVPRRALYAGSTRDAGGLVARERNADCRPSRVAAAVGAGCWSAQAALTAAASAARRNG